MYQQKDKIQNLILLALDTICMIASYFLAGLFLVSVIQGCILCKNACRAVRCTSGILIVAYAVIVVFFNYNEKYMQQRKIRGA